MLNDLLTLIKQTRRDERGATMVEYGLLVALIAVVVVPALLILGPAIVALFTGIAGNL
jgi:pilus assembly protein Flp/PilA